jgi:TonB family protein
MILKLTALMLIACMADLALRRAPAALRHLMWTLTMMSALLLPVGGLYAPRVAPADFVIRTPAVAAGVLEPLKFNWILAIYACGVALMLTRLVLDILAAQRLVRQARPTSLPGILVSGCATVPFAWGVIVVPEGYECKAAVIAHEAAHLARGDVWSSLLANLTCCVYWFHPLVWWAASRQRLEADRACDDAVLRAGFGEEDYAGDLVQAARQFAPSRLAPGAVCEAQLQVRMRHILSKSVNRRQLGAAAVCMAGITCFAVFSPLAALSQRSEERVYSMGAGLSAPRVVNRVEPRYTKAAIEARVTGPVVLTIVVGSDGVARDIKVKRTLDPGLDANAVAAVRRWKFQPALKAGSAVSVRATIEVNFRLM